MPLEELTARANREFDEYVRTTRKMTLARADTGSELEAHLVVAIHSPRHHNHALILAEDLEGVLLLLVDLVLPEVEAIKKRLRIQGRQHGIDDLQADSAHNVFTNTVYAFTRRKPRDWDLAVAEYKSKGMRLILRDDVFDQASSRKTADVFICHCTEDMETVARPLFKALFASGLLVWLDEVSLTIGDSLIGKIDEALGNVPFGVVVISPAFLTKHGWTEREFQSLATKEIRAGKKVILPVWHNVTSDEVAKYSLALADKVAAKTSAGIPAVCDAIRHAIHQAKSVR